MKYKKNKVALAAENKIKRKNCYWIKMKTKIYYFTFFDSFTQRSENLKVEAKTFAEAVSPAYIHRQDLNKQHNKSNWDIIMLKSKDIKAKQT